MPLLCRVEGSILRRPGCHHPAVPCSISPFPPGPPGSPPPRPAPRPTRPSSDPPPRPHRPTTPPAHASHAHPRPRHACGRRGARAHTLLKRQESYRALLPIMLLTIACPKHATQTASLCCLQTPESSLVSLSSRTFTLTCPNVTSRNSGPTHDQPVRARDQKLTQPPCSAPDPIAGPKRRPSVISSCPPVHCS